MNEYTILSTTPTVFNDPIEGIVNGVLVVFNITEFNERGEIRLARMDATAAKAAISSYIENRKALS